MFKKIFFWPHSIDLTPLLMSILLICFTGTNLKAEVKEGHVVNIGKYSLSDLIEKSANHARVASGQSRAEAAEKGLQAAWQQYLPTPGVSYSKGDNDRDETVLSLQQPLWAGGRIDAGVEAASAQAKSSKSIISEQRYQLALAVIDNYQKYIRSIKQQEALKRFNMRLSAYKARMDNRVNSGASPENDMALLISRISTTSAQMKSSHSQEEVALTQLSQLTNISLDGTMLNIYDDNTPIPPLNKIIEQAKATNPSLHRLQHDIEEAEANVRIARAALSPTVSLVLKHSMYNGNNVPSDDSSINLQVQLQTGAGLSAFDNIQAAQARVQALKWSEEATRQELEANIRSDYESLNSIIYRIVDLNDNASSAERVLESYERLFIAGKRSWMDVMNAARDLSDADIAVVDNEADKIGAQYKMELYNAKYQWQKEEL